MIQSTVVAALAGARLTRAWLHEEVGEPFREPIEEWADPSTSYEIHDDGTVDVLDRWHERIAKKYIDDLVTCPFCIGFWFTFAAAVLLRSRWTRPLAIGLAGAALQSAIVEHYPQFDPDDKGDD